MYETVLAIAISLAVLLLSAIAVGLVIGGPR